MKASYSVADAAFIIELPESHIRGWLQRAVLNFGSRTLTRRIVFNERDLRCLAVMRELVAHGLSPNIAAVKASFIVDRARDHALVAVVSLDPGRSPMLIPGDGLDLSGHAVVTVALAPMWAEIKQRIRELKK
ncbi:MerR family transcriptional regulator [Nitratireductor sp. GCM10026969]|uniref:MerR family transcriptional regulator n=1 Tax=Nitratireductor sp. GCM10026969 TaxID=3252645 RepID=UPI003622D698